MIIWIAPVILRHATTIDVYRRYSDARTMVTLAIQAWVFSLSYPGCDLSPANATDQQTCISFVIFYVLHLFISFPVLLPDIFIYSNNCIPFSCWFINPTVLRSNAGFCDDYTVWGKLVPMQINLKKHVWVTSNCFQTRITDICQHCVERSASPFRTQSISADRYHRLNLHL